MVRRYQYVGPASLREAARTQPAGAVMHSQHDLADWLRTCPTEQTVDGEWVATFVIDQQQQLLLAPRRSEHVACAQGGPVLSAGEMTFAAGPAVVAVSNQSTGFCPEPDSWPAVEGALDAIGVRHPGRFTTEVVFRLCEDCSQISIVKDDWYVCVVCDAELPRAWNFSRRKDGR
ncbi:MAG: hypothetical protein NXI04_18380 [Planctomycetaceae bacterium]|nr:hypothetical protein [Planctomycetaceae bacterium]